MYSSHLVCAHYYWRRPTSEEADIGEETDVDLLLLPSSSSPPT